MSAARLYLFLHLLLILQTGNTAAQVKIRLFADRITGSAIFKVIKGMYRIECGPESDITLSEGQILLIARYNEKVVLKIPGEKGQICDSVFMQGSGDDDLFSLRLNDPAPVCRTYSGRLKCSADLGTLLFVNDCDIDIYIAGVVKAEGGSGKKAEYFKSQAVIARTYMYRHFDRHIKEGFNLCDNTHCQAFNGVTADTVIIRSADETSGEVILGPDSTLIISAFHSNCGGETSPSEYVWLSGQQYFKNRKDPYCLTSPNAVWQKKMPVEDWIASLRKGGFEGNITDRSMLNFAQTERQSGYSIGSFSIPLRQIRDDLGLRSTFFSVYVSGDSVLLKGRGYGHGVGLCQEGAMVMAQKGYSYRQIIGFYYKGVFVSDIKYAGIQK